MLELKGEVQNTWGPNATTAISVGFWERLQVIVRRSLGADSPFVATVQFRFGQWARDPREFSPGLVLETIDSILYELQLVKDESPELAPKEALDPELVFVVYGRDRNLRDSMFSFLRALGLNPIEWETAAAWTGEAAPYVGTILDVAFRRVQAVVVMLTPDEAARLRPELADGPNDRDAVEGYQARPNVLFEAGMAMGLHPERTIIVTIGETRVFSDIGGRTTIRLTSGPDGRNALANRLKTAGCAVDTSGADWLTKGSFVPVAHAD